MTPALAIVTFVVVIIGAILVHELGHLVAAKLFGMRADRYFVGFGPTLWSTRRGETEYGVKALPLGGFVSIRGMTPLDERRPPLVDEVLAPAALAADRRDAGVDAGFGEATFERLATALAERGTPAPLADRIVRRTRAALAPDDGEPALGEARGQLTEILVTEVGDPARVGDLAWRLHRGDAGRFYGDRPPWQRAVAVFAGPVTHLFIAFGLMFVAYLATPLPTGEVGTEVAAVVEDSPAEQAGLRAGDVILAVEDVVSDDFFTLRDVIRDRPGQPTTLLIERDGAETELVLEPSTDTDPDTGEEVGVAGYAPLPVTERLTTVEAAAGALRGSEAQPVGGVVPMLGASVQGLVMVFSPEGLGGLVSTTIGAQERDPEGVVSVIGIANLAGQTAEAGGAVGLFSLLLLLAYVNTFLFILNLVPLPPFDGGHLAVTAIEKAGNVVRRLRGRPQDFAVDPRAITAVAVPVIGVLLLVVVTTLWLDIRDPLRL